MRLQESDPVSSALAAELWQEGLQRQLDGELEEAMRLYRSSLDLLPSAEAHTFLGWSLSFQGRLEEAIEQCRRAIDLDPDLGNPWNDIGAYLVELGRTEDAFAWFERAKLALRYETPQFPYLNLARIHMARGRIGDAALELQAAGALAPDDDRVSQLLGRLEDMIEAREGAAGAD